MKYHAIVSDTNELFEANSFKELYRKARHIIRSSELKRRKFLVTLARGNKQIGLIFYESIPNGHCIILEKATMSVYIYSGKEVPHCRKFAEHWQWIAPIEIEGEEF